MDKKDLIEYKKKLASLTDEDIVKRNLYLKQLADGTLQGPMLEDESINKKWLKYFTDFQITEPIRNDMLVTDFINENVNREQIVFDFFGTKFSKREYEEIVEKIKKKLYYAYNIKDGDFVAVNTPNSIETFAFIDALTEIGAIPSIFDPRAKQDELEMYIKEANCKIIFTMTDTVQNVLDIQEKFEEPLKIITMDITTYMPFALKQLMKISNSKKIKRINKNDYITWKELIDIKELESYPIVPKCTYYEERLYCLAHTSGTTCNQPKGTKITHKNINTVIHRYRNSSFEFLPQEKFTSPTPIHLIYGMVLKNTAYALQQINYILPKYDPNFTIKYLIKNKINHIAAGPADVEALVNYLEKFNIDVSFIKTIATGGGKLHQGLKDKCYELLRSHNCYTTITEGYGSTENTGPVITNLPDVYKNERIGVPFADVNIEVATEDTIIDGELIKKGELFINSESITPGYINENLESPKINYFGREYIRTKDIVSIDEEGFIEFKGRNSNIIPLYNGENISPIEIEEKISRIPGVIQCAVIGIDDIEHEGAKVPCAYVVSQLSEFELSTAVEKFSGLKSEYIPKEIYKIDQIPITKNGKVDYITIEKMYNDSLGKIKSL